MGTPAAPLRHVTALCDRLAAATPPGPLRDGLARVRDELDRPLRLVVVGRLNAGKSTLVNALLGQRVAAVGATECTRVLTRYRYGTPERAAVVARDGRRWEVPLDAGGRLPADLGAPAEQLAELRVTLSLEALRRVEVVDTPGLDSLSTRTAGATEAFLGLDGDARAALAASDVVVFLLPHLTAADEERLRALTAVTAQAELSVVGTVGVLSRADQVDGAPGDRARSYRDRLRGVTVDVVAVSGLLAETVGTGSLTEAVVADLVTLAAADDRELLLASTDWFTDPAPGDPVPAARRAALLELLDLTGLRLCLELVDAGHRDATTLGAELLRRSGVGRLADVVERLLGGQSAALRAHRALRRLERLSFATPAAAPWRDEIDELRDEPELHRLRELDVLARWSRGELDLPARLSDDLVRLAAGGPPTERLGPGDPLRAALDGATRWLAVENGGSDRATVRAAEVLRESYTRLWQELRAGAAP